jgi:hypothetical protein
MVNLFRTLNYRPQEEHSMASQLVGDLLMKIKLSFVSYPAVPDTPRFLEKSVVCVPQTTFSFGRTTPTGTINSTYMITSDLCSTQNQEK